MKLSNKTETAHAMVRGRGRCSQCHEPATRAAGPPVGMARLYCEVCLIKLGVVKAPKVSTQLTLLEGGKKS